LGIEAPGTRAKAIRPAVTPTSRRPRSYRRVIGGMGIGFLSGEAPAKGSPTRLHYVARCIESSLTPRDVLYYSAVYRAI